MIDYEAQKLSYRIRENKKQYTAAAVAIAVTAAVSVFFGKFYTGWLGIPGTEYQYFIEKGDMKENSWVLRGETEYFHTDSSAKIQFGLQDIDGNYYFFNEKGVMEAGWKDLENGKMHFGKDGKAEKGWYSEKGKSYLFSNEGIMQTGWAQLKDGKYYLSSSGERLSGWQDIDGKKYYFTDDGKMQTGWQELDKNWFLFAKSGEMLTGEQKVDGKIYYLNEDGKMLTGWRDTEKGKVYHVSSGESATGWTDTDDGRFYFSAEGILQTGDTEIDGEAFHFEDDGTVDPGWHESDDGDFYVCYDGAILDTDSDIGNYGRLVIRDCGIDVAVYEGKERGKYQDIVDKEDSAVAVKERRDVEPVIADRRSQGFELDNAEEGTIAYMITSGGKVEEYACIKAEIGKNDGGDVKDDDGNSIWRENQGGFGAYARTGGEDTSEVFVTLWEKNS